MEVAQYAKLCSRLSRFLQDYPSDVKLQKNLDKLVKLYDRLDGLEKALPRVEFAAFDELILLTLHKLLDAFMRDASKMLQEQFFTVFARVLRRCKSRMQGSSLAHVQRRLHFVQSCVLYLPPPLELNEEKHTERITLASQSEELRIAVLHSLQELFDENARQDEVIQFQVDQHHFFAYIVSSLLHIAKQDRCRAAALLAVKVLKCVLFFIRDPSTLRQYLPGVAADLWKCANAPQQASKVTVAALNCFALALYLCIGDESSLNIGNANQGQQKYTLDEIRQDAKLRIHVAEADRLVELKSTESEKWLQTAAMNVDLLLSRMFAASVSAIAVGNKRGLPRSSWRVRCALAQLCDTVMLRCRIALRISFFRCYDELLVLQGDSIAAVAHEADKVLQKLQLYAFSSEERLQVLPEMADRFQMLLSTLVLKLSAEHESTKIHFIRILRGYLAVLGSSLSPYFDASMDSIYTSLCRVASFAALDIELIVNRSLSRKSKSKGMSATTTATVLVSQYQKRLHYFREEASVDEVFLLLQDVGIISNPAGFIDCAISLLSGAHSKSPETGGAEAVLVFNEFLRAYCKNTISGGKRLSVHLIGHILEDLLALEAWDEHKSKLTSNDNKALVSQRALMVECVGVCAEILGADFKVFLLHVLYPLVEQLGSQDVEVERAALAALEKIYFFMGYESLGTLFEINMDYFVDSLCARLEQLEMYPMTAFVVEALLRHTRLTSLPLFDEVASSLLISVDLYQDSTYVDGLLRALKALLSSISRDGKITEAKKNLSAVDAEVEDVAMSHSLLNGFIHEMKVLANININVLDNEDNFSEGKNQLGDDSPEQQSVMGALPLEYDAEDGQEENGFRTLVIDIMERCGYFLVESNPIACCLVLSLIDEGVRFLSKHKKQLLPLVAQMWPELLPRLRVKNRAIVTGTIRVITTVAEIAKDFVGDRFVETVWPILRSQLQSIESGNDTNLPQLTRSMLLLSKEATSNKEYVLASENCFAQKMYSAVSGTRISQEIRQLLATLSCLTMVCSQSETVTQLVPEITYVCSKFLSCAAPQEVVEQTTKLFWALARLNGDEVFCALAALADWMPRVPPCTRFSAYDLDYIRRFYRSFLSNMKGETKYCRDNARILMNCLFI